MKQSRSSKQSAAMRRVANRQWVLKPQDLAVALKLAALKGQWLPYAALGESLRMSRFEAHAAVQRLLAARLVVEVAGPPRPVISLLLQFLTYGAPYAYPPVRGEMTVGFPTAHGVSPLKEMLVATNEPLPVWPHPHGPMRGEALLPLYENLPLAAAADPAFYELLALFDALRAGRAREREMARKFLEQRLQ